MTREPFWNVQMPRVGEQLGPRPGTTSDAYEAANEAYQVVMVGLAKLIGFLFLTAFGVTVVMTVGYCSAGWAGAAVLLAVIGMVLAVAIRAK